MFYDRFSETLVLQADRFNGINQQQFVVNNPDFFPVIPSIANLPGARASQTIQQIAPTLRAPYTMQSAIARLNDWIAGYFT